MLAVGYFRYVISGDYQQLGCELSDNHKSGEARNVGRHKASLMMISLDRCLLPWLHVCLLFMLNT